MKLNQIADNKGANKKRMRLGQGVGSGKGKTAGEPVGNAHGSGIPQRCSQHGDRKKADNGPLQRGIVRQLGEHGHRGRNSGLELGAIKRANP